MPFLRKESAILIKTGRLVENCRYIRESDFKQKRNADDTTICLTNVVPTFFVCQIVYSVSKICHKAH